MAWWETQVNKTHQEQHINETRRERKKITAKNYRERINAEILRLQQNRTIWVENEPSEDLVKSALTVLFYDKDKGNDKGNDNGKEKLLPPKRFKELGNEMEIDCRDHKPLIKAFTAGVRRLRNMESSRVSRDKKKAKLDFLRSVSS